MKKNVSVILAIALGFSNFLSTIVLQPAWVQANPIQQETRGTVLYVSSGGAGICTSWADTCDLQAAITAAVATDEIWVQVGTYLPTLTTDRTISFELKNGVAIYGGFAGTETAREQRNWTANPTILSGDIGAPADNTDNTYHVVYGSNLDSTAILDGFTITAGNANGTSLADRGGGMYNSDNYNLTLSNLFFSDNSATYGGGVFNQSGIIILTNVTFFNNSADIGGGMFNNLCSANLTNVVFYTNSAQIQGGGMVNKNNSDAILLNVTFSDNSAVFDGGGIYNWDYSDPILINVTLSANVVGNNGGGMYNDDNSNSLLINTILWGNMPDQVYNDYSSTPVIAYSIIQGGYSGEGNIDLDPLLGPLADNGGFTLTHALLAGSPAIDTGNPSVCPATDQRGITRPIDGDGDATSRCDMGAYEYEPVIYYNYIPLIVR